MNIEKPKNKGMVYLVGAGPGRADLITVRGAELLKTADCIIYDKLANPALLSYARPDARRIVSSSRDSAVRVWDAETGEELMILRGHGGRRAAFSPDGKRIVLGGIDGTIKIWDSITGAELMTLRGHSARVFSAVFSPDGKRIVSGSPAESTIKVWDAGSGAEVLTLPGDGPVMGVAFSPDGKRIISGSWAGTIKVWDSATGTELITLVAEHVSSVAFSPDGKRIISSGEDDTIMLWDGSTGTEVMTLRGHKLAVAEAAFSPDGKRIVSGSGDGTVKVWDAASGTELMTLVGHEKNIWSVAFSPDGMHIISSSEDKTIKVWDAAIRPEVVTLSGHRGPVPSITFGPDGKRIVSASLDKTVKVWDAATGAEVMTLCGHDNGVIGASFSPDGKRIISSSMDKTVKIWDAANGAELMTLRGHDDWVGGASFSPDGRRIVSSGKDSTVRVWDAATSAELMILRGHGGRHVTFSPDGKRIVLGSNDGAIKVWDASTGAEVMTLREHSGGVYPYSLALSPDGKRIVSGGWDPTIKVWDAGGGAEVLTLPGDGPVMDVAISPDGKRIISGSMAGTVKVWDSATGTELMTLRVGHGNDFSSVAFSPDGKTIAAGIYDDDNNIKLWESTTPAGGYELRRNAKAARKVVDELVDELYEETGSYNEVIDKLNADKTLDESVRKMALQFANSRRWEDAKKLRKESFEVVSSPGAKIEAYRVALGKAEMANRLEPNNQGVLIILGLAQYRVGAYQDVLTTLIKCENWRPGPFVFKAMALHQLGRDEEARAALNRVHVLLEDWLFDTVYVVRPFVIEAEKLLAGEGSKLYSLWESIEEGRLKEAVQLIEELRSSKDAETTAHIEGAVKWLGRAYYNRAENKIIDGKFAEAISDYEEAVRVDPGYALALNDLAWLRATCLVAEFRDGAKAIENATKACELTNWKKAHYVGTLAAAYAEAGDFDSAVKQQKKAIDLLTDEEEGLRADFEERLKLYQSGKPYRRSPPESR